MSQSSQKKDTEAQEVYIQSVITACGQIQAWNPGLRVRFIPFSIQVAGLFYVNNINIMKWGEKTGS